MFPVASGWKFNVKSMNFLYSLLIIISSSFLFFLSLFEVLTHGSGSSRLSKIFFSINFYFLNTFFSANFAFYMFNLCMVIDYVAVARKWKCFMLKWDKVLKSFVRLKIFDVNRKSHENLILFWFVAFVLVQNFNYILFLSRIILRTAHCTEDHQGESWLQLFLLEIFPEAEGLLSKNVAIGSYFLVIDYVLSMVSVFSESFIITKSQMIARKIDVFNKKVLLNLKVTRSVLCVSIYLYLFEERIAKILGRSH